MSEVLACAVCGGTLNISVISGLRRGFCSACHHSQRIDIKHFDYTVFAMGGTGLHEKRLTSQVGFVARYLPPEKMILEIGCAKGTLAERLKPLLRPDRYEGIELSPVRYQAAEILDRVYDKTLPDLLQDGEVSKGQYGAIIISHCLEHIEDIQSEVGAIKRALDDHGYLFIELPNRSGNAALPFDDNFSHLHFFSVYSLTRLLALHGLEVTALETGAWHDTRYPDCIRLIARPVTREVDKYYNLLSSQVSLADINKVIVWGAGKMAEEMLAHFFDVEKIVFFVDNDPAKHGTRCLDRPVKPTQEILNFPGCTILINSLEYEQAIRHELATYYKEHIKCVIGYQDLLSS